MPIPTLSPHARLVCSALAVMMAATVLASANPAQAAANSPCYERRASSKVVKGTTVFTFRMSPKRGSTCSMNMALGGQIRIDRVRTMHRPTHGRLLSVKPNRIVYKAGDTSNRDAFSLEFLARNRSGKVAVLFVFEVRPR